MANLATALRAEATRIARRELRAEAGSAKKLSADYRREIAELERRLATLEREVRAARKQAARSGVRPLAAGSVGNFRYSSSSVKVHRKKLGLSAAEYASLLGVHAMTVYNWEHGRSKPRRSQMAALAAVHKLSKKEVLKRLEG